MKTRSFAAVADGDVFWILQVDESHERYEKICGAILRSNSIFIEITDLLTKPDVGWTWNGSEFVEPYIGW